MAHSSKTCPIRLDYLLDLCLKKVRSHRLFSMRFVWAAGLRRVLDSACTGHPSYVFCLDILDVGLGVGCSGCFVAVVLC